MKDFSEQEKTEITTEWTEIIVRLEHTKEILAGPEYAELAGLFPDWDEWQKAAKSADPIFYVEVLEKLIEILPTLKTYAEEHPGTSMFDIVSKEELKKGKPAPGNEFLAEIISVRSRIPEVYKWPIDKVTSTIFTNEGELAEGESGPRCFLLKADPNESKTKKAKKKNNGEVNIYCSIDFNALKEQFPNVKILDRLTQYDKRGYIAICNLWLAGNDYITLNQIYRAMGHTGNPSGRQREEILAMLVKFYAPILLDNREEIDAGYNYPSMCKIRPLMHIDIDFAKQFKPVKINGSLVQGAVKILEEPILLRFSRERKQITEINANLLNTPYKHTEENMALDDYLIRRCKRANGKTVTILLDTLYENVGIKTAKQKQRAPAKIVDHLDHFRDCGEIISYKLDYNNGKLYIKPKKPEKPDI